MRRDKPAARGQVLVMVALGIVVLLAAAGMAIDVGRLMAERREAYETAADLMVDTGVGRIPIVEPKTHRVVGILSRHDLLKARSAGQRTERVQTRPA